jgi:histo-blood group ABO system transferase
MKISLLIVATNKYVQYLPNLVESVVKHFMTTEEVKVHIFTDRVKDCDLLLSQSGANIQFHEIEHKEWPYATLYRFHFFQRYIDHIQGDFVFYIDADTIIKDTIHSNICSDVTVVQHCGYVNGGGSWEKNPASECYVEPEKRLNYYGGGFYGFKNEIFKLFVDIAVKKINKDSNNGIVPVWHDESVLNHILAYNEPANVLSPSYHWPQNNRRIWDSWKIKYHCIILLLDKNHKEIRE